MNIILGEAKKVCITLATIDLIFILIALLTKTFDYTVATGLALGNVYTLLNFILLGTIVEKAVTKTKYAAKRYMQINYLIRLILTGIFIYIGFMSPYLNPWGVVISLFAPKLTYYTIGIYSTLVKKKKKQDI